MNQSDLDKLVAVGELKQTAASARRGYTSRKSTPETRQAVPYKGRFGEGYCVYLPRWDTTRYCYVVHYLKP